MGVFYRNSWICEHLLLPPNVHHFLGIGFESREKPRSSEFIVLSRGEERLMSVFSNRNTWRWQFSWNIQPMQAKWQPQALKEAKEAPLHFISWDPLKNSGNCWAAVALYATEKCHVLVCCRWETGDRWEKGAKPWHWNNQATETLDGSWNFSTRLENPFVLSQKQTPRLKCTSSSILGRWKEKNGVARKVHYQASCQCGPLESSLTEDTPANNGEYACQK